MPPTNGSQDATQAQQLLQGFNTMQAQMGLMPGGAPPPPPPPMMPAPHPGQVAGMLAQQAMQMQYVAPPQSPMFGGHQMAFPSGFGSPGPAPLMGRGAMARQRGVHEASFPLGMAQAGTGFGLRMGGNIAASALGSAFGGPLGGMAAGYAFEASGMGQGLQNMGNALFEPIIQQRERAFAFQNQSMGFVRGGSQMSAQGQGMSAVGSQQVVRGLNRMADSSSFRKDTQGMFNREDLSRITRLSGELGMLDNAQTADQITREVKKVSKALSSFMKLAEEPDVRAAMHQMSRMRSLGFGTSEIPVATANARTFARMAGVSISDVMAGAERGAAMYQGFGLSGATGFQAGMGAQGAARQLASGMDPRRLSMAGGVGGIEQTMLGASAQAATLDMMLPAMLTRRHGRLGIDADAVRDMASGGMSIEGMARRGGANLQRLGPGAIQEIFTQRRELQDEISRSLGPQGQMLLPIMQAQMISQRTGMGMGASLRTLGLDEQQARTLEQAYESPDFMQNMRRQRDITNRERAVDRRDNLRSRDTVRGRAGRIMDRRYERTVGAGMDSLTSPINEYLADEQDREEAAAMQGDGPYRLIRRDRNGSDIQAAHVRDRARTDSRGLWRGMQATQRELDQRVRGENQQAAAIAEMGISPFGIAARALHGPDGVGFSTAGQGGTSYRNAVLEGTSLGTRIADRLGAGPTVEQINALGAGQTELSGLINRTQGMTDAERAAEHSASRRGWSTRQSATQQDAAIATAASAARGFVRENRNILGGISNNATGASMRAHIKQQLVASGQMSEAEASRFVANDAAVARAIESSRRGMTSEERETLSLIDEQGNTAEANLAGQSQDQLRGIANDARDSASELLGLNDWGDAADASDVFDVIGGTGDDADMRRKVYAALAMEYSDDDATKQRGTQLLETLEREARAAGKIEAFEAAKAAAQSQLESMDETDREQMAARFEGKSAQEAVALVNQAGEQVNTAGTATMRAALGDVLGARGASTYARLGSGAAAVRELRRNPNQVTDRNIRNMMREGKSDDEIARAIETGAAARISSGGSASAEGAGTSEADRAAGETGDAMAAAIEQGRSDFPSAVTQFSEASTKLLRAAEALQGEGAVSRLMSVSASGGTWGEGIPAILNPFGFGTGG